MCIIPEETPVGNTGILGGWRCNTVIYEDISAISTDNVMTYTKIRKSPRDENLRFTPE